MRSRSSQNSLLSHQTLLPLFTLSILSMVPLLPYLVNGAPLLTDSWAHLKIARETVASGSYTLSDYGARWPLVNLLLTFIIVLTAIPELYSGAVILMLAGLATIPLYCFCRRLGLSSAASLVAASFLTFNPLYSYITFTGAVMKESATYYLTITMPLLATLMLKARHRRSYIITVILFGLGLAFGQHYAALTVLLFLWAMSGYLFISGLKGETIPLRAFAAVLLTYTGITGTWNIFNYLSIGSYFPIFNPSDLTLLLAAFIVIWLALGIKEGAPLARYPWLPLFAFIIALYGLRGGIYLLTQPAPPISIWELRNYTITGAFALAGLSLAFRDKALKAFAASVLSLLLFAYIWGFTQPGYVLLIKSLHYYGILLAVGFGFTSTILLRKGILGRVAVISILLFTVYISATGTELTLKSLSAYHQGELIAASELVEFMPGIES